MKKSVRRGIKRFFSASGVDLTRFLQRVSKCSVWFALKGNGLWNLVNRLRTIVPDISCQEESSKTGFNDYWELKRRGLQAFQCKLMLKAVEKRDSSELTVVDIGDSAGTHMLYLKELVSDRFKVDSISVNLDKRAIEKIKARGQKAILCRAEELDLGGKDIDMFTSFEMVEHLHNPAIFFRRLAKKASCNTLVMTVPYLKQSRVGVYSVRTGDNRVMFAEDEHIFELSPSDWSLLIRHAGWKVVHSQIYYQYPRYLPGLSQALGYYWRQTDFEGFWGAILKKDTAISDLYQDWPV